VNDVKDVLSLALDTGPDAGTPADPREDLARGRRLLRRRRMIGAAGVAAAMVIGAGVPLALQHGPAPASHGQIASSHRQIAKSATVPAPVSAKPSPQASVRLVAWRGTQPPGYEVNWMPSGWIVQGSTPFALVIAPTGDSDTSQDSYLGKLVVMLQSKSVTSPPAGAQLTVNGRPAVFETAAQAGGDTEILYFKNGNGQWALVQAPMALGWDSAKLAQFCSGVTVLAAAQQGVG
jgi:hypothetical protein